MIIPAQNLHVIIDKNQSNECEQFIIVDKVATSLLYKLRHLDNGVEMLCENIP